MQTIDLISNFNSMCRKTQYVTFERIMRLSFQVWK